MTKLLAPYRSVQIFLVTALVGGLLVLPMTEARANHGDRTLQVRHDYEAVTEVDGESSIPGNPHELFAILEDASGLNPKGTDLVNGEINIDFEIISGPGDITGGTAGDAGDTPSQPDLSCSVKTIDDPATPYNDTYVCRVTYQSNTEGTDLVRAWIDHDKNDATTAEADLGEGRVADNAPRVEGQSPGDECPPPDAGNPFDFRCAEEPQPGTRGEVDQTDVVRVNWAFPQEVGSLDCEPDQATNPATGTGSTETYTCTLYNTQGQPMGAPDEDWRVDGENLAGANDPDNDADGEPSNTGEDSADYDHETPDNPPDPRTGHFCTISEGSTSCSDSVRSTEDEAGAAEICFWAEPDSEHENTYDPVDPDGSDADSSPDPGEEAECLREDPSTERDQDLFDVVVKTWEARTPAKGGVDAEPETDVNNLGDSHTITATVYDQFGEPFSGGVTRVKFELFQGSPTDKDGNTPASPDLTCDTKDPVTGQPTSSCSVTYSQATTTGRDLICVWTNNDPTMTGDNTNGTCNGGNGAEGLNDADDAAGSADAPEPVTDDVDVVEKHWVDPSQASQLNCEPETDTNPQGSEHDITCTARAPGGATGPQPVAGVRIDVEATGANDPDNGNTPTSPDFTCTTRSDDPATPTQNEQGTCVIRHGGSGTGSTTSTGTTTYRAWIDKDNNDNSVEADTAEGRDESKEPGNKPEPDDTDVVEKTWVLEPATVTISPKSDSDSVGNCNPYTVTVKNRNGEPTQGAILDVEQRHDRAANQTQNDEPDVEFCVPSSGPNPSGVDESRGDQVEPNQDNPGTAGGETTTPTDANGQVTFGIRVQRTNNSDGTGNVSITVWFDKNDDNDDPDQGEPQDTATKTWTASAAAGEPRTINCEPNTATNPVNTSHTVTCTVTDSQGRAVANEDVTFSVSGVGTMTSAAQQKTNASGQAQATTTSSQEGTQQITGTLTDDTTGNEPSEVDECDKAANDPSGAPAGVCSETVTKTWTAPPPPQCADGQDNDGDGRVDEADPDCSSAEDNNEAREPQDVSVATNLTIRYDDDDNAFKGAAGSSRKKCQVGRVVKVKKVRPGRDRVIGSDTTGRSGNWLVKKDVRRGRYYGVVMKKTYTASNGDFVTCQRDRSVTIKI